jgi:hypothetical protein
MKLGESVLKCYEWRKTAISEEVEVVTRGGKEYWVCPKCFLRKLKSNKCNPVVSAR